MTKKRMSYDRFIDHINTWAANRLEEHREALERIEDSEQVEYLEKESFESHTKKQIELIRKLIDPEMKLDDLNWVSKFIDEWFCDED